jgi:hypothetical protein
MDPTDGLDVLEMRKKYLSPAGIRNLDHSDSTLANIHTTLYRLINATFISG